MYGIPNMKLDKGGRRAARRSSWPTRACGSSPGSRSARTSPPEQLLAEFDAVVLATGATVARDLAVPGRELGGIHLAMNFLRGNTRRLLDAGPDADVPIDAAGKDVVVIGGGDTGTDCVGTAIRQGARQRAPARDPAPAARHARGRQPVAGVAEGLPLDYGQEEATALWGEDPRRYSTTTRRFIGRNERVTGDRDRRGSSGPRRRTGASRCGKCRGPRRSSPPTSSSSRSGFTGPEPALPRAFGCDLDPRGNWSGPARTR